MPQLCGLGRPILLGCCGHTNPYSYIFGNLQNWGFTAPFWYAFWKKKKNDVFWCFKLFIVEKMIPKGGFVFCLVFKRFKLVTVEINPQGRIFVENLGVFVFRVWSSEKKKKKTKGDFIWWLKSVNWGFNCHHGVGPGPPPFFDKTGGEYRDFV